MDLTRAYIDGLSFTVKKGKYYLGNEVDEALDTIASGLDELQQHLSEYKAREEKMAKIIIRYQNADKQRQQEAQAQTDAQTQLTAANARIQQLQAQLQAAAQTQVSGVPMMTQVAPQIDPEQIRMAAQAERTLAEYKATREQLISELTSLQTKRDSLEREIRQVAGAAAKQIMALAEVKKD